MKGPTAFLIGASLGGVVAGLFAVAKGRELRRKGLVLTQALTAQGHNLETYLIAQGGDIRGELAYVAATKGESLARVTAERLLAREYGITEQWIDRLRAASVKVDRLQALWDSYFGYFG